VDFRAVRPERSHGGSHRTSRTLTLVSDDPSDAALRWQVHGERTLYDNPWVRLTQVDVTAPDGQRWWHHVVRLQTVAMALVLDDADRVLMLWRHRFAVDAFGWELPGGIVTAGESGADTAVRETLEETGWRPAGHGERLAAFQPMPGMVDTPHEVYLFRGAEHIGEPTDAEEAGRVAWLLLGEVPALVQRGQVAGSGSLVGLLCLLASRGAEH
jgi:8-oxo-dGTP pyrophosphatase MutT (NUDIX family)